MTTQQVYNDFKTKLKSIYEDREAENISDWIFERVTGLKGWERRINQKNDLKEADFYVLQEYLQKLMQHKPVQYVLNEAWFYKMKFFVNENVLIPRPETEELIEWIINDLKVYSTNQESKKPFQNLRIIDIGTGSGCIAVSIKKEIPDSILTAIDVSETVLEVARKNALVYNQAIDFLKMDFLNEAAWNKLKPYDIIVSNPPYIPIKEKEILAKNVTDFEPQIALFVKDIDPFIFYERITKFGKTHLKENGQIYVEVHEEYAKQVQEIFKNAGFRSVIKKDIYGKERMVKAEKKHEF